MKEKKPNSDFILFVLQIEVSSLNMWQLVHRIKFLFAFMSIGFLTLLPFAHVGSCEVSFISLGVLCVVLFVYSNEPKPKNLLFGFFCLAFLANSCRFGLDKNFFSFYSLATFFACMQNRAYFRRLICWVIKMILILLLLFLFCSCRECIISIHCNVFFSYTRQSAFVQYANIINFGLVSTAKL